MLMWWELIILGILRCYNGESLQCRRILGGKNLVHVRIVVAAIFDFMTEEDWGGRLGRVEVVTLRIGARAKERKGGGGEEKKYAVFPSLSPPPSRSL